MRKYKVLLSLLFIWSCSSSQQTNNMSRETANIDSHSSRLSANEQLEILWEKIARSEYHKLPPLSGKERILSLNPFKTKKQLMELRKKAFDHKGDYKKISENKMSHIHGPAAVVDIVINKKSPFTGLFREGIRTSIMRASFAFNPKSKGQPHHFPQPGLALKIFVDGKHTKNILAMGSLDGEGSDARYFSTAMATKLKKPKSLRGKIGEKLFNVSTMKPGHLRLTHLSSIMKSGKTVSSPITPTWIQFRPTSLAKKLGSKNAKDFRAELLKTPVGSKIYALYAYKYDSKNLSTKTYNLGYVVTKTRFIASEFADKVLHFRHEGASSTKAYRNYKY